MYSIILARRKTIFRRERGENIRDDDMKIQTV